MTVFSRRSFPLWGGLTLQGRAVKLQGFFHGLKAMEIPPIFGPPGAT